MAADADFGRESISADLARANLLRMRGDHKGAIDQCLSVLKRDPESVDAHMLIAEIHEETGDLGQAAQWYELALDLDPRNPNIRAKAALVTEEMRARETAGTAKNLTLPPEKPPTALYVGIILAIAIVVGFGAYLSEGMGAKKSSAAMVPPADGTSVSIVAPGETPSETPPSNDLSRPSEAELPEEDRTLVRSLAETAPTGTTVLSALQDPRTNLLIATYAIAPEGIEPTIAAEAARAALGKVLSAPDVTIRIVKGGRLSYVATVERSRLAETETPGWRQANPSPDAWLRHVLQQEWGAAAANPAPSATETTAGTGAPLGTATGTASPAGGTGP